MGKFKQPEGQLARWIKKLREYQFDIGHRLVASTVMLILFPSFTVDSVGVIVMILLQLLLLHITLSNAPVLQQYPTESLRQSQLVNVSIGFVLQALGLNDKPAPTTIQGSM